MVVGSQLDAVNALACIATALAVFPVMRRVNESLALGVVMSRMFEAAVIMVGVVSLLAVVTLRQDAGGEQGADQDALVIIGAPLLLAVGVATVLGLTAQGSVWFAGALPVIAWEPSTVATITP